MNKLLLTLGVSALSPLALAKPVVVTSIKPVSMVVAAIAGDRAEIEQIVSNSASPHDFALRPSDLRKINNADTVVWVGESLERFLEKPLENAGKEDTAIEWLALEGMNLHNFAEGHEHHHDHDEDHHDHEEHDHHDEHDHDKHHDDHDEHDHDKHHDDHEGHDHDEHDHEGHDHDEHHEGHEGHDHTGVDPHVWLSPENAKVLAAAVAQRLSDIDSQNASYYKANLAKFEQGVAAVDAQVKASLAKVHDVPYIVFHDGYSYFEQQYGLNHVGEITVSPERKPGAKKVAELRHMIEENKVQCVFSEPQFSPAIVKALLDGSKVNTAPLDPLGGKVTLNSDAYYNFLEGMADTFSSCLR
ncbi:zinc ABC transporter substrate-binding protein [Marinomonas sp. THO17]|uniref:zinc ABC transporter substrate-binding protein n=1 Tax=Marinomonas sp. THO17 TaxID=3149048 RepID=UPI00336C2E47